MSELMLKETTVYFLNHTISLKPYVLQSQRILGHSYVNDIIELKNVIEWIKIRENHNFEWEICNKGKNDEAQKKKKKDKHANWVLDLVHYKWTCPIDLVVKDDFLYALCFVDNYSGLIKIYFLRQNSDILQTNSKYLVDITQYGLVNLLEVIAIQNLHV